MYRSVGNKVIDNVIEKDDVGGSKWKGPLNWSLKTEISSNPQESKRGGLVAVGIHLQLRAGGLSIRAIVMVDTDCHVAINKLFFNVKMIFILFYFF